MEDGLRDLTAGRVLGEVEEGRWRQGGGGREGIPLDFALAVWCVAGTGLEGPQA